MSTATPIKWPATGHAEIAEFFGVTVTTVRRWAGEGMPSPSRPNGKAGRYDLSAIAQWLRAEGPWRVRVTDPMLGEGDSPALERYRLARAAQEEIKLELLRGTVIPVDCMRERLARLAAVIRHAGEHLGRTHGPEAHAILNEALEEYSEQLVRSFGGSPE